jgi:hypothetical protein
MHVAAGLSATGSRRCAVRVLSVMDNRRACEADAKAAARMRPACEECKFASEEVSGMACAKTCGGAKKSAKTTKKATKKK